jgi:hypothetical protein
MTEEALEFTVEHLRTLLIAMPCRDIPTPECERYTINPAMNGGAIYCPSSGYSDPALHRNLLAKKILNALEQHPRRLICLMDDDMVVPPLQLAQLCETYWLVRQQRAYPAVSAAYMIRREGEDRLAAVAIQSDQKQPEGLTILGSWKTGGEDEMLQLPGVYTGLGCLVMEAEVFRSLCETSPQIRESYDGQNVNWPALFQSGAYPTFNGQMQWASEDTYFCERLWGLNPGASGVYLARHIHVGHVRVQRRVLIPDELTPLGKWADPPLPNPNE